MNFRVVLPLIVVSLILNACSVEKKLIIPNADPDKLFIRTQAIIKDKIPSAKMQLDMDKRYIKAVDSKTMDYPTTIELRFSKEGGNTVVSVTAVGNEQRLENLKYILTQGLTVKEPSAIPVAPRTTERPGHAVISQEDLQMDLNKDGWITPQEEGLYRQQQDLLKQKETLQKAVSTGEAYSAD